MECREMGERTVWDENGFGMYAVDRRFGFHGLLAGQAAREEAAGKSFGYFLILLQLSFVLGS